MTKPVVLLLVELALKLGKIDELAAEIEQARKKMPSWNAGDFLLAMVLCRSGKTREAEALVRSLPETIEKDVAGVSGAYLFYAYHTLGVEVEQTMATSDLAAKLYEHAMSTPYSYLQIRMDYDQTPLHRLVNIYRRDRRFEDARRSLLKVVRDFQFPEGRLGEEIVNAVKMQLLDTVAKELIDLGFAAEAIPVLNDAVNLAHVVDVSALPTVIADVISSPAQVRQHLTAAIDGMTSFEIASLAGRLIAETNEVQNMNKDASQSKQAKPHQQALDLVLMVHPRELDKATVRSLLAESLAACDGKQLAALDEPLEALRKSHPDDLSIAIATALRALAGNDAKRTESAVEGLIALVEKASLEPLPSGTRAELPPTCRGRTVDSLVGCRPRLLETTQRGDAHDRRPAGRPGARSGPAPER